MYCVQSSTDECKYYTLNTQHTILTPTQKYIHEVVQTQLWLNRMF